MNEKQKRFAEEFLIDLNSSAAARRAGFSEKTAGAIGHELLKKPEIQAKIRKGMQRRSKRIKISQDRVLLELARCAFSDLRRVVSWDSSGVTLLDSSDLKPDEAATVSEITATDTREGKRIKVKLWSKLRALELLSRHLGLFEPTPSDDPFDFARRVKKLIQMGNEATDGDPEDDDADPEQDTA